MSTDLGGPAGFRTVTFAEALRTLRAARSLTQEELADRARLTVKAVGALERGERRRPYPHTVRSLAEALHLDDGERDALIATLPRRPRAHRTAQPDEQGDVIDAPVPAPAGPVVGRDDDLATVIRLLRDPVRRVITLTGPGGVGKTTLALLAAEAARNTFPDGVTVVELADVDRTDRVWPVVAAALRIPDLGRAATAEVVARYVGGRRLLLVLDNLEHLVSWGPQLARLSTLSPELVVLATSRAPLRIRPEQEIRVTPLAEPATVRLLRERATAAGVALDDDPATNAAIATLSKRTDGLPLAIELAASAAALFGIIPLLGRLDALSMTGARDLPQRQSSMDATIAWSDGLLTQAARTLLRRLSVCVGGFSLAVVDELSEGNHDDLSVHALVELIDQSLVVRLPEVAGTARFRLLVPVREYAGEQLTAAERLDARARLSRSLLETTSGLADDLRGPAQTAAMQLLDADLGNIGVIVTHLLATRENDHVADLLWGLSMYLASRGYARDGIAWIDELLTSTQDDLHRARALTASGFLRNATGDLRPALSHAKSAFAIAAELGQDELAAEAGMVAATSAMRLNNLADARTLLHDVNGHAVRAEGSWLRVHLHLTKAQLIDEANDAELDAAAEAAEEAEAAARALELDYETAFALNLRALIAQARGRYEESAGYLAESVELCIDAANVWLLVHALPAAAVSCLHRGDTDTAVRLFGAAAALTVDSGVSASFSLSRRLTDDGIDVARKRLDEIAFKSAYEAGRSAGFGEVARLARSVGDVRGAV